MSAVAIILVVLDGKLGRFNHPKEFHKKPETIPKAFPPGPIQPARGNGSQLKSGGSKDG